jgi:hypothetical protein
MCATKCNKHEMYPTVCYPPGHTVVPGKSCSTRPILHKLSAVHFYSHVILPGHPGSIPSSSYVRRGDAKESAAGRSWCMFSWATLSAQLIQPRKERLSIDSANCRRGLPWHPVPVGMLVLAAVNPGVATTTPKFERKRSAARPKPKPGASPSKVVGIDGPFRTDQHSSEEVYTAEIVHVHAMDNSLYGPLLQ